MMINTPGSRSSRKERRQGRIGAFLAALFIMCIVLTGTCVLAQDFPVTVGHALLEPVVEDADGYGYTFALDVTNAGTGTTIQDVSVQVKSFGFPGQFLPFPFESETLSIPAMAGSETVTGQVTVYSPLALPATPTNEEPIRFEVSFLDGSGTVQTVIVTGYPTSDGGI